MTSETTPLINNQPTAYSAGYWRLKVGSSLLSLGSLGGLVWSVYSGQDAKLIGTLAATTFTTLWAAAEGWNGVRKQRIYTQITPAPLTSVIVQSSKEEELNRIRNSLKEILDLLATPNATREIVEQFTENTLQQEVNAQLNSLKEGIQSLTQEQTLSVKKIKATIQLLETAVREFEAKVKKSSSSSEEMKSELQDPSSLSELLDKLNSLADQASKFLKVFDFQFGTPRSESSSTSSSAVPSPNREAALQKIRRDLEIAQQTFSKLSFEETDDK